jgi:GMP synthase (glutamine-hydrolysing)
LLRVVLCTVDHSIVFDVLLGLNSCKKYDKTLHVFQWHGDTYDLPPAADIIASSTLYPQAFRYGSAVGIQFHLEVNGEMIQRWLQEYSEEIFKEHINSKDITLYNERGNIADLNDACKVVYSNFSKLITKRTS